MSTETGTVKSVSRTLPMVTEDNTVHEWGLINGSGSCYLTRLTGEFEP